MAGRTHDEEFGFQIAPMLDILFVLLLFFIVSAGVQKREASLRVPLPGTKSPSDSLQVDVEIAPDGEVMFNGVTVDSASNHALPELDARLKAVLADAPDRAVVIRPDPSARHQRVMDVLDACKYAGVKNVAFGAL